MEQNCCINCGSDSFVVIGDQKVCKYCNSKYEIQVENKEKKIESAVSLQDDIDILLQKCKKDPQQARKFAGLILDIDPTNIEALKYFNRK